MNQLPANVEKVSDIVKVLNGGIEFYKSGINQITTHNIQVMFQRMLEEKKQAVLALKPYLNTTQSAQDIDTDCTIKLRSMYARLSEILGDTDNYFCIEQLEEVEDRVLDVIDAALETNPPQHYACELRRIRTRMQQCHDEMRYLQAAAC